MEIKTRCWRRPFYPSNKLAYYETHASPSQHLKWHEDNPAANIVELCLGYDKNNNPVFENDIIGKYMLGNIEMDITVDIKNVGDDFSTVEVIDNKREKELEEAN